MIHTCQLILVDKLAKRADALDCKEDINQKSAYSDTILNIERKDKCLRDEATAIIYIFSILSTYNKAYMISIKLRMISGHF